MRVGGLIVLIWLVIGAIAAGPLNYVGVNPKISCHLPTPSS